MVAWHAAHELGTKFNFERPGALACRSQTSSSSTSLSVRWQFAIKLADWRL